MARRIDNDRGIFEMIIKPFRLIDQLSLFCLIEIFIA